MASIDFKVEDSSPLISYSPDGAWTDSPDGDSLVSSYSGSSLHSTAAQGATATINFNGTGISLFGAKRPNYGDYTISVDGKVVTNGNAKSDNPSVNQLLGEAKGLSSGPHTVVLTNTGGGTSLDIDRVQLFDQIGPAGAQVKNMTIDDSDPRIQWGPSESDWSTNPRPAFINSTLHFSSNPDASATVEFSGDAVAIYGTVSPDHADINVNIDGQTTTLNGGSGKVRALHPQTLLYYADKLGSQQHKLIMSSRQKEGGPFIDLDAITVYSATPDGTPAPGNGNNPSVGQVPTNSGAKKASGANPAVIGGAVAGAITFLVALAVLFYFFRRLRRRRSVSSVTPSLPFQGPDMVESGLGTGFRSVPITPFRLPGRNQSPKFFPGSQNSEIPQTSLSSPGASSTLSTTPMIVQMPAVPQESHTRDSIRSESRFTISDYEARALPPIPPMPPVLPLRFANSQDHISRFTISDYTDGSRSSAKAGDAPRRPSRRPPTLKIP